MQKFQAKGGVTTPGIELTSPSDGVVLEVSTGPTPVITTEVKSNELNVYYGGRPRVSTNSIIKTDRTRKAIQYVREVNGIIFVVESDNNLSGVMDIYKRGRRDNI